MRRRGGIILLAVLASLVGAGAASAGEIAVVVHGDVAVDDLSFRELRKILLGDRQFWPSGQPVTLIVRAPAALERTVLLRKVYEMNEAQYRQYWIAKVFRAEATSGPKVVVTNTESLELVAALPGAIALVNSDDVPSGYKILTIDGRAHDDPEYALRADSPNP